MRRIGITVLALLLAAPALAQDEEVATEEASADEWARPRILLVRGRRVSNANVRKVREVLEQVGDVVDGDDFVRRARSRGLPRTAGQTFERLMPEMGVALAVVLSPGNGGTLQVTYREGTSGFLLLEEEHAIAGPISDRMSERIQAETRLAMAVVTRPDPETMRRASTEEITPGAVFGLKVGIGIGIGSRDTRLPSQDVGQLDLDSGIFAAAGLDLEVGVRARADSRTRWFGRIRYATSLGLRLQLSALGADQDASSRSQHFDAGLGVDWSLKEGPDSAALVAGLGWAMRRLSTEGETLLPDYGLSGARVDLGVRVPFFGNRIELRLIGELQTLFVRTDSLQREGVSGVGIAYGGVGQVSVKITDTLAVSALFRESHARYDRVRDAERWVMLQLGYAP